MTNANRHTQSTASISGSAAISAAATVFVLVGLVFQGVELGYGHIAPGQFLAIFRTRDEHLEYPLAAHEYLHAAGILPILAAAPRGLRHCHHAGHSGKPFS